MAPTDAVQILPVSPGQQTPPNSPDLCPHERAHPPEQVQLFVDLLLKAVQAIQSTPAAAGTNQPATTEEAEKPKIRASKLDYKLVDEMYVTISITTFSLTLPA